MEEETTIIEGADITTAAEAIIIIIVDMVSIHTTVDEDPNMDEEKENITTTEMNPMTIKG